MSQPRRRPLLVALMIGAAGVVNGCASTQGASPLTDRRYGPNRTWMDTQFDQVVAQKEDFSCGAAALATLLRHYYGREVSEADVLALAKEDETLAFESQAGASLSTDEIEQKDPDSIRITGFSFAELARFANHFGFEGRGYRADFEALRTLKVPVIAHIGTDWYQHFVVLREVNADYVVYADPTWGNRRMPAGRFQALWGYSEGTFGRGRVLAILPNEQNQGTEPSDDFFSAS